MDAGYREDARRNKQIRLFLSYPQRHMSVINVTCQSSRVTEPGRHKHAGDNQHRCRDRHDPIGVDM